MRLRILDVARNDLVEGANFYDEAPPKCLIWSNRRAAKLP